MEQASTSRVRGFAFRCGRILAASCLAGAAAVLVPGVAVPAGAALLAASAGHHALVAAPTWTGAEAPLPAGQKYSALFSVVCPVPSTCIAVGESILTGSGPSWSASPDPAPANAAKGLPKGQLYQISCWSASGCVAAGEYTPKSGPTSLPLLVVKQGSTWKAVSVPLPANASKGSESLDGFFAVGCQSASTCLAAGYYTDTSGETQGLLATRSGSSWTVVEAPLPSGMTSIQMVSADCPAPGVCVAGGQNLSGDGGPMETGYGTSWTVASDPYGFGGAVACPASTQCVLASGDIETGLGSSWTNTPLPLVPTKGKNYGGPVLGLACASVSDCTAGGYYATAKTSPAMIVTGSGSTWAAVSAPQPKGTSEIDSHLNAVACPTASACVVAGNDDNEKDDVQGLVDLGSGSSWTPVNGPLPANSIPVTSAPQEPPPPQIYSVVCTSVDACVAVGLYETSKETEGWLLTGPA